MENDFCRQINDKLNPDERIFKFKSAELVKNNLNVVLMVRSGDYSTTLTERLKSKVQRIAEEIVPEDFIPLLPPPCSEGFWKAGATGWE